MNERIPDEEKRMGLDWMKAEAELQKEGAVHDEKGVLEVTQEQIEQAKVEMAHNHMLKKKISRYEQGVIHIGETRTFKPSEIAQLISQIEGLKPTDLTLSMEKYDSNGNAIELGFTLKEEVALEKFGLFAEYYFTLRHENIKRLYTVHDTHINRFTYDTKAQEYFARVHAGLDLDADSNRLDDHMRTVQIARYFDNEWKTIR